MAELSFDKMDTKGDGKVTLDEFVAAHGDMIKKRFAEMDANGDGVLTKDEVEAARGMQRHDKAAPAATAAAEKQASTASGAHPAAGAMAALSFEKMDAKGDGKVTTDEFQAVWATLLTARFAAMDTNGDGVLTKEEVEAARAAHRPHGQHGQRGDGTAPAAASAPQK